MRLAAFLLLLLLWTWFLLEVAQLNRFQFRILLSPLISVSLFLLPPVVAHQQFRHCCSSCNSAFCWLSSVYVCVCARASVCCRRFYSYLLCALCYALICSPFFPASAPASLLSSSRGILQMCLSFFFAFLCFFFFFFFCCLSARKALGPTVHSVAKLH